MNKVDSSSERCNDIIDQLDVVQDTSLAVLSDALVGTVVSKFKAHSNADVAAKAKGLVKTKQAVAGRAAPAASATKAKDKPVAAKKPAPSTAPAFAASSSSAEGSAEWNQLPPPFRKNTANKLYQTFELSITSLTKSDIHIDAKSLNISRATEVEAACHEHSKGSKAKLS